MIYALALVLLSFNGTHSPPQDSVDLIEVNHVYSSSTGEFYYTQYLFFRMDHDGQFVLHWTCPGFKGSPRDGKFRLSCGIVRYDTLRVTHTTYDREHEVCRTGYESRPGVFGKNLQPWQE